MRNLQNAKVSTIVCCLKKKKPSHTPRKAENATLNKRLEIINEKLAQRNTAKLFFRKRTLFSCLRVKLMFCAGLAKFNCLRIDHFRLRGIPVAQGIACCHYRKSKASVL